jgi:hypothetical protein
MPSYSGVWNLVSVYQAVAQDNWTNPATPIGIFTGGEASGTRVNTIDYITISTTGDATDFGDLLYATNENTSFGSSTRGFTTGSSGNVVAAMNVIQYINLPTGGASVDFGDLLYQTSTCTAVSSSTRGVVAGGRDYSSTPVDNINYVTMASAGNAVSFGTLSSSRWSMNSGCASPTRGLFFGGRNSSNTYLNIIYY